MRVELTDICRRQLKKLDSGTQRKIIAYLSEIELLKDPRSRGKALVAEYRGKWHYRVGDYRLICEIQDEKVLITVIKIGHRSNVYAK